MYTGLTSVGTCSSQPSSPMYEILIARISEAKPTWIVYKDSEKTLKIIAIGTTIL